MTSADELLRVQSDDPEYLRLAADEAAYWDEIHPRGLESVEMHLREGPADFYTNRRFTGDPHTHWEETIRRYGSFRRGLVLGTSSISVESRLLATNPHLHATFIDISPGALTRRADKLGARFPGRVDTEVADLNFFTIKPESYDLIVSCGAIHHVTNLEHLAYQINRGLTREGFFFLQDYVGEPRFTFSETKVRIWEELFVRQAARIGRGAGLTWLGPETLSPLCGVRSDEILTVFSSFLQESSVRTAGALFIVMMRSQPADRSIPRAAPWTKAVRRARRTINRALRRRSQVAMDPLLLHDVALVSDVLSDAGVINPGNAFVVYRRRE